MSIIRFENQCVDCGLPCIGTLCPYIDVPIRKCDNCGDEGAEYIIDGEDFCEDCAERITQEEFNMLSTTQKINILDL